MFNSNLQDVRSDNEESDVEIEAKQGEGHKVGISGGESTEKKAFENGKPKGINGMNGKVHGVHDSHTGTVSEGKKHR